jgi:hypothetical protein
MTAGNGNRYAWTLVGILASLVVAGSAFVINSLSKADRSELTRVEEGVETHRERDVEKFALLESTVVRNTERINHLIEELALLRSMINNDRFRLPRSPSTG